MTTSVEERLKASTNSIEDALQPKLPYSNTRESFSKVVTSQSASKGSRHHHLDDKKSFTQNSSALSKTKTRNRSISSIHPQEVMRLNRIRF